MLSFYPQTEMAVDNKFVKHLFMIHGISSDSIHEAGIISINKKIYKFKSQLLKYVTRTACDFNISADNN